MSVNTNYVRNTTNCMRVLVTNNDPTLDNMGVRIGWCLKKLDLGQIWLYYQVMDLLVTDPPTGQTQYFHANLPLEKNIIAE